MKPHCGTVTSFRRDKCMAIKNYTTKISAAQTVGEIQALLAKHGARKIMLEYGDNGAVSSIVFALDNNGQQYGFRLEPKTAGVSSIMAKEHIKCDKMQAERIAWRNIKDWIAAQIALVESEQAEMEELFLPYLIGKDEKTVYEIFKNDKKLLE